MEVKKKINSVRLIGILVFLVSIPLFTTPLSFFCIWPLFLGLFLIILGSITGKVGRIIFTVANIGLLIPVFLIYMFIFRVEVSRYTTPVYTQSFPVQMSTGNEIFDLSLNGTLKENNFYLLSYLKQQHIGVLSFHVQGIGSGITEQEIDIQKIIVRNKSETTVVYKEDFEIRFYWSYYLYTNGRTDAEINSSIPGVIKGSMGDDVRVIDPPNSNHGRFAYFIVLPESIALNRHVEVEFTYTLVDAPETIMTKVIEVEKFKYRFVSRVPYETFMVR